MTARPNSSDRAVADAPIIWFMTSLMALMFMSLSSNSSSVYVTPISISTMTLTSLRLRSMMFLPVRPSI